MNISQERYYNSLGEDSITAVHGVGIKDPLVLKTDTQETENLVKAIFLIKKLQICAHSS
jgi:hypothetical protein